MNNLEQLKAIIYEKLPELKALTFGCEVYGDTKRPVLKYIGYSVSQHALLVPSKNALLFVDRVETEILGHPIRFEHVVCMIIQHGIDSGVYQQPQCKKYLDELIWNNWNLSLPLDDQKPEVHEWLLSILQPTEK